MANFLKGLLGGAQAAGTAFGGPWGALAGGVLGGMFGGGSEMPEEQKRLYKLQLRAAKGLQQFAGSVPLSSPGERAALAQQKAFLGEQQRNQMGMLQAAQNPNVTVAPLDFLRNLTSQQQAQQSAIDTNHLLAALSARNAALGQSAQIASGAVGATQLRMPGADFSPVLQQLAQMSAYQRELRRNRGYGVRDDDGGGGGGGIAGIGGTISLPKRYANL